MAARAGRAVPGRPGKFYDELVEELIAFAEHAFRLDKLDKKGVSRRQHLESVERQTKRRPADLDGPPMPPELAYLWSWFIALHEGRTVNGMGPSPATHLDLWAWRQNAGLAVASWEMHVLLDLGRVWMSVMADRPAPAPAGDGTKPAPRPRRGRGG